MTRGSHGLVRAQHLTSNPVTIKTQRLLGPASRARQTVTRARLQKLRNSRIPREAVPVQWGRKLRSPALSCVKVTPSRESCLEALGSRQDWALTHRPDVQGRRGCSWALLSGRPAPPVTGLRAARAHVLSVPAAMETQESQGCSVFLQNPVAIRPFIC